MTTYAESSERRFWAKVNKNGGYPDFSDPLVRVTEQDGECWVWTASKLTDGYGSFWYDGRTIGAHRYRLAADGTKTPEGHQPDHLCRRPACVRPNHFEIVPLVVNVMRSANPFAANSRKTHCIHGHEFTPENTRPASGGRRGRRCRECSRIENREGQRIRRQVRRQRKEAAVV